MQGSDKQDQLVIINVLGNHVWWPQLKMDTSGSIIGEIDSIQLPKQLQLDMVYGSSVCIHHQVPISSSRT